RGEQRAVAVAGGSAAYDRGDDPVGIIETSAVSNHPNPVVRRVGDIDIAGAVDGHTLGLAEPRQLGVAIIGCGRIGVEVAHEATTGRRAAAAASREGANHALRIDSADTIVFFVREIKVARLVKSHQLRISDASAYRSLAVTGEAAGSLCSGDQRDDAGC